MIADQLLPEVLKDLWQQADEPNCTGDQYERKRRHCLDRYHRVWKQAPLLDGYTSLRHSLLLEPGEYVGRQDPAELERRCAIAWKCVEDEWLKRVDAGDPGSIDRFYDREAYLYNLTWWHTLIEDDTPLAYVTALHFARRQGLLIGDRTGGLLFARHRFNVASADISSSLLRYSSWRFSRRAIAAVAIGLKELNMPKESFDLITAMDGFEHLRDPERATDRIAAALKSGGLLYGRFAREPDDSRPQHIVADFEPVFQRLRALGFKQIWEDDWVWDHQVFQKP